MTTRVPQKTLSPARETGAPNAPRRPPQPDKVIRLRAGARLRRIRRGPPGPQEPGAEPRGRARGGVEREGNRNSSAVGAGFWPELGFRGQSPAGCEADFRRLSRLSGVKGGGSDEAEALP